MKPILSLTILLSLLTFSASAAEHKVASAADIARLSEQVRPGDVLIMTDGTWSNQTILFRARGTADNPITLRAATPGKVLLTGTSSLIIDGEHLVVSGLLFKDAGPAGEAIAIRGSHCRLTDTAIIDCAHKFFVRIWGVENRMDHCYLAGKTSDSPTLQIEAEGQPNRHRIDHNHFGHRPPLGRNGGETIRVGYSWQSMTSSATLVERNFFDRCDGEIEIISSKSCDNIYRANTFLECAGMLTLRHGNRCTVEGNFFLGQNKRGSGGIRIIGDDHIIINNYIDGVRQGGFWITSGIPDSPLVGYFQARNCLIAFNTFVDSRGPAIDLDAGFGSSRRSLRPENITIANNLFVLTEGPLRKGQEGEDYKWLGNIAFAPPSTLPAQHDGIRIADPELHRAADGLLRPAADSPLRSAARGDFAAIRTDIDGQPRTEPSDVGCDQLSDAPVTHRPLTAAEVGPSWLHPDHRSPKP